jgi:hypothetical protein
MASTQKQSMIVASEQVNVGTSSSIFLLQYYGEQLKLAETVGLAYHGTFGAVLAVDPRGAFRPEVSRHAWSSCNTISAWNTVTSVRPGSASPSFIALESCSVSA